MSKTRRQEITSELYNELSQHHVDSAAVQIEQVARVSEGVMIEEQRALPVFFKAGGIYTRLLDKHPEFRQDSNQAQQAEDAAIAELKSVIETKLASSHDRLNSDHVVGAQAAQEAVTDPSKRYRREYEGPDRMMTFDDIGRLHSALRLICNDATIDPASPWKTKYFNGVSGYQGHSYRHFLALIWKGATESDMVAPVNFTGMTSDELKGAAVEQIISALAQCRREHNYDRARPDWDQTQAPKDAQRCDMGLRGDLFGQMLMYNEHYMQTRAELNIELIEPLIRDFMVEEFTELSPETKVKIISYLDNKAIALGDPEPEEEQALDTFVASMKASACDAILQKMMSAGPESPLSNIQKYIRNIQVKIQNPDAAIREPAAAAMLKIQELINDYVALEANSLFLLEPGNSANMDFLRRFAMHGIHDPAMGFMQGQQVPQHLRQATHSLTAELNPLARPLFAAAAASTPVLDSLDAAQPSVSRVSFFKPPTGAADVLPPELVSELAELAHTAQEVLSSSAGLPALSTTDGIISAARDVIHPDFANRPLTVVSATLSHAVEAFSDAPDVVADTSQPSGPSESYKACCRHFIDLCLRILGIIEQQTPRPA